MKEKTIHVGVKRTNVGRYTILAKNRKFKNSVPVKESKLHSTTFQINPPNNPNLPIEIKVL